MFDAMERKEETYTKMDCMDGIIDGNRRNRRFGFQMERAALHMDGLLEGWNGKIRGIQYL